VTTRQRYLVVAGEGPVDAALVCEAVFAALDGSARSVSVDAYSDVADALPAHDVPHDIRAAEQWLRAQGFRRDDGDPGTSIRLHHEDETGWTIARSYAPWSVHVALYDAYDATIASIDDGGHSVLVAVTADEATLLAALISPAHGLEPLAPLVPLTDGLEGERTLEPWTSLQS
jgi:hypothetical protein